MWIMTRSEFIKIDDMNMVIKDGFLDFYNTTLTKVPIQKGLEEALRDRIKLGILSNKRVIEIQDYQTIGDSK